MEFNPENKNTRRTKIGTKGQVIIPQDIREVLNIKIGDRLIISQTGDDVFEIYTEGKVLLF